MVSHSSGSGLNRRTARRDDGTREDAGPVDSALDDGTLGNGAIGSGTIGNGAISDGTIGSDAIGSGAIGSGAAPDASRSAEAPAAAAGGGAAAALSRPALYLASTLFAGDTAHSEQPDPDPADPEDPPRVAPNRRAQIARLAFLALTLAAGAYAVGRQWTRVQEGFAELGPVPLLVALVPALASVGAMMLAWRGLLGSLGSPLRLRPASRIFFTSQLGKYLPGSVWPVVAQMQLGRAYRIPRARSAAAAALAMLVSLSSALVLAAATLPLGGGANAAGYRWAFAVAPLLLAGLHPRIANPVLKTLFRLTRRPAIEPLTARTLAETAARSVAGWLLAGAHIWVLAVALGATPGRTLLLAIGGYAFAWSVGFIIVFAPAGAGVRELILVAALQPVLDPGKATVVALASRLVTIVADLVAAALTAREGRTGEADSAPDGDGTSDGNGNSDSESMPETPKPTTSPALRTP